MMKLKSLNLIWNGNYRNIYVPGEKTVEEPRYGTQGEEEW